MQPDSVAKKIAGHPRTWVVTGVAGFIGSHIGERLIGNGQTVIGVDDLSSGSRTNVELLEAMTGDGSAASFRFIDGSIEDPAVCAEACEGADIVLHEAALGSIPRSIENPVRTHEVNVTGTLNMLVAANDAGIRRFVYASSSSVYGDDPSLPKVETRTGTPLAPYATSKTACELYARNFAQHYAMEPIGLRYFNVFGPRQDPRGAYAAVVPRWIAELARGEQATVYGDGETSRDFCYVENVVDANILAALTPKYDPARSVFNIAAGGRTSLNQLYRQIAELLAELGAPSAAPPLYERERPGDVRHSQADISRAAQLLGYQPAYDFQSGLKETVAWYWNSALSNQPVDL